jgi:hypothetical protein
VIEFPVEIVSAEIKIDPLEPVVAFGQAIAYRLFSTKTYIAMPTTLTEEDRARISILDSQVPFSINRSVILWSCKLHFPSESCLLARPSANSAPPGKSKTGKSRLFSAFHKHLADPHSLAA